MPKTGISTRDAVVMLIERQLDDVKEGAAPVSDFYVSVRDTYRFDVTGDEIRKLKSQKH